MRGFTLLEIALGTALFGLVMLGAVTTFTAVIQTQQKAATGRAIQQEARYALDTIVRDTRIASHAEIDASQIILTGALSSDTKVRYYLNVGESRIYREICGISCGAVGDPLTSNSARVTDLAFSNPTSNVKPSIRIDITMQQRDASITNEKDPYYFRYDLNTLVTTRE